MRVLYITSPSFFDLDISLVRELSSYVEIDVLLLVSPLSMRHSAFSIDKLPQTPSIQCFKDNNDLHKYRNILDENRWYIASVAKYTELNCFRLGRKVREFIKENGYTVIHSTGVGKQSFHLIPYIYGLKRLLTMHDPICHDKESLLAYLRRFVFVFSYKNILLLSNSLQEAFCHKFKLAAPKIHVSRLSIYDCFLSISFKKPNVSNYFLFFGRIEDYKGVDILIEAFLKSKARKNGVKLVIAGKGDLPINYQSNNDVVVYNRFIENEELAGLINESICVILPYKSATQSGCVMTSFAFNKPVIVTNVGDLPLEVDNNMTGWIVPPCNSDLLADAMDTASISNLSEMANTISNLYSNHGERSWDTIARNLVDIYKKL